MAHARCMLIPYIGALLGAGTVCAAGTTNEPPPVRLSKAVLTAIGANGAQDYRECITAAHSLGSALSSNEIGTLYGFLRQPYSTNTCKMSLTPVRLAAISVIGQTGTTADLPVLDAILGNPAEQVLQSAASVARKKLMAR